MYLNCTLRVTFVAWSTTALIKPTHEFFGRFKSGTHSDANVNLINPSHKRDFRMTDFAIVGAVTPSTARMSIILTFDEIHWSTVFLTYVYNTKYIFGFSMFITLEYAIANNSYNPFGEFDVDMMKCSMNICITFIMNDNVNASRKNIGSNNPTISSPTSFSSTIFRILSNKRSVNNTDISLSEYSSNLTIEYC